MKLDRNTNTDGTGKYALILLRDIAEETFDRLFEEDLVDAVDFGNTPKTEFFVIRLKDKYAAPALAAYALSAWPDDQEWALEILNLAKRAAEHPNKQQPT